MLEYFFWFYVMRRSIYLWQLGVIITVLFYCPLKGFATENINVSRVSLAQCSYFGHSNFNVEKIFSEKFFRNGILAYQFGKNCVSKFFSDLAYSDISLNGKTTKNGNEREKYAINQRSNLDEENNHLWLIIYMGVFIPVFILWFFIQRRR